MNTTLLTRIQNWYLTNCNGDWEHSYGISITTLDNPGWKVKIDLTGTCLQNLKYEKEVDNGTFDWLSIKTSGQVFEGFGDAGKLTDILAIFLDEIIPEFADPRFEYKVYVPLSGAPVKLWTPVKAKMITEDTLEITHVREGNDCDIRALSVNDMSFEYEDVNNFPINLSVGDLIKVELVRTFMGLTLIAKE